MAAILRLNVDDNPKIVVKADSIPVIVTGATYYDFIQSGATIIKEVQGGNHIDVTIYSPFETGVTQSQFTSHTGDTTIHFKQSSIIITESQVTGLVGDLAGKSNTGHTHSYTGPTITNKPGFVGSGGTNVNLVNNNYIISSAIPSGTTVQFIDILGNATDNINLKGQLDSKSNTGHTHSYTGSTITDKPNLSIYNTVVAFTGHTSNTLIHQTSGNTQSLINNSLSGYWNSGQTVNYISGVTSGLTSSWTTLQDKPQWLSATTLNNFQTGHAHSQYLTGVTWGIISGKPSLALQSDFTSHTGDTTIHFKQSGITITESQVTGLVDDLAGKSGTGHTHNYTGSTITNKPIFTGSGGTNVNLINNNHYIISSITPTGTTVQFIDILGNATDNVSLKGQLDSKSNTGHTHSYTGSTITDKPILFTGDTYTASGATILKKVNNNLTIYTPVDSDNYVPLTIYQTYTGTTAPAAFASKSFVSTYTGTTAPAAFASKSFVSTYTGTTAPAAFASKSFVSTYTGTTAPNTFLKLNQQTPQTITNGCPVFNEGIIMGEYPTGTTFQEGRLYWTETWECLNMDMISGVTLQVGQEELTYVYNNTASPIEDGKPVYVTGIYAGANPNVPTIALAIATGTTKADVYGFTTMHIPSNSYGYLTVRGNINDLDTLTAEYSGMTAGDKLYLSSTIFGGVVNVVPPAPAVRIELGRLVRKNATTGMINVRVVKGLALGDLTNVVIPSPTVDDTLKWNGQSWINGPPVSSSASAGVEFFNSTPIINSRTNPAGLSPDGATGNGIQVATLSKTPVTTGATLTVSCALTAAIPTRVFAAWLYPTALGRTLIDSGSWKFDSYISVDSIGGGRVTTLTRQLYQVVPLTSTVSTSGSSTNSRVAIISTSQFAGTYFAASATLTTGSFLQTPSGIYKITAVATNNRVTIVVPTGYSNETNVSGGKIWNKLFGSTSGTISSTSVSLYQSISVQPSFVVAATDMLGQIGFGTSNNTTTLTASYNGTVSNTHFITPLVTLHNNLAGLNVGEYQHLTSAQLTVVQNTSNTNTGDETKATIESKLTGAISSHTHPLYSTTAHTHTWSTITTKPAWLSGTTLSAFEAQHSHASLYQTKANTVTGITSMGTGTTLVHGTPVASNKVQVKSLKVLGTGFGITSDATTVSISGSTTDIFTNVADGEYLLRSGTTIVGGSGSVGATWASVTGKPAWLSGTTLSAFEAQHAHASLYQSKANTITGATSMGGITQVGANSENKVSIKGLAASGLVSITTGATLNTIVGNSDSTKLTTTIYQTYTGTTAPAAFASKSFLSTYTGTTAPAAFASKSFLSTYTGTTAPAAFASKSFLSTYTGTTAPAAFASKSFLSTYTGTTVPNTYQTKLANLVIVTGTTDTIANGDNGTVIKYTNASARTVTLPTGLTTNMQFTAINYGGTTTVSFAAGTGAIVRSKNSMLKLATIYGAATWIHEGAGIWLGIGDLST